MTVSCFTCGRTCGAQRDLDQHLSAVGHWRGLECDQCDLLFFNQRKLVSHIKAEHGYNFVCEDCDDCFIDNTALEQHRAAVHDTLTCRYCLGSKFKTQAQLESHLNRHHNYSCEICGEFTRHRKKHDRHVKQHENDTDEALAAFRAKTRPHKCPCCESRYKENATLQSHIATAHPWKCDTCNSYFDTQFAHDQHRSREHNSVKLPCEHCKSKLANAEALQEHMAAYHYHKCEKCAMVFSSATSLEQHYTQTHVIKCLKCGETFGDAESRRDHIWKTHAFRCCDLAFISGEILQAHKDLAHFSSCEACSRTFPSRAVFEVHCDEVHNHNCEDCQDNFTSIAELETHRIAKHPVQQTNPLTLPRLSGLQCPKCLEELDSAQDLLDHDKKVHRHICEMCDATFESHPALKKHTSSAHVPTCPSCSMQFPDARALISHYRDTHLPKCKLCAGTFRNPYSLFRHMTDFHATREDILSESDTSYETSPENISPEKKSAPSTPLKNQDFFTPPSTAPTSRKDTSSLHQHDIPITLHQNLPIRAAKPKPKPIFQCDKCIDAVFDTRAEYDDHMKYSPFHDTPVLKCFECNVTCKDQIALLVHIESKPHNVRWVLSMINTD
jgi:hypothetical protein